MDYVYESLNLPKLCDPCLREFTLQDGANMVLCWKCIKSCFHRKNVLHLFTVI